MKKKQRKRVKRDCPKCAWSRERVADMERVLSARTKQVSEWSAEITRARTVVGEMMDARETIKADLAAVGDRVAQSHIESECEAWRTLAQYLLKDARGL